LIPSDECPSAVTRFDLELLLSMLSGMAEIGSRRRLRVWRAEAPSNQILLHQLLRAFLMGTSLSSTLINSQNESFFCVLITRSAIRCKDGDRYRD
jgi:hypothetical protein